VKKDKILLIGIALVVIIGLASFFNLGQKESPVSAEGMTEEQRADFDQKAITTGLKDYLDAADYEKIEKVKVDHKYKSIELYALMNKSDQYSSRMGGELASALEKYIDENTAKLTLEEPYTIMVMGRDGQKLNK
jgi:hypothetical protein